MLTIGDIVPAIDIATDTGRFSLAQHDGKKMVIFFFLRADTPACTKSRYNFRNLSGILPAPAPKLSGFQRTRHKNRLNLAQNLT